MGRGRAGLFSWPAFGCLVVACATSPTPGKAGVSDLVERLIERTNGLRSFAAEYAISGSEAGDGRVRILYRAPDLGKIAMEGDAGSGVIWMVDGTLVLREKSRGQPPTKGTLDLDRLAAERWGRARALLLSEFGELPAYESEREDPVGLSFHLAWSATPISVLRVCMTNRTRRGPLFSWLGALRRTAARCVLRGGRLVVDFEPGTILVVSAESGFLERIEREACGRRSTCVLERLELGGPVDEREFDIPPAPEGAMDVSAQVAEPIADHFDRWYVFGAVETLVREGRFAWDVSSRERMARVLKAIHAQQLGVRWEAWIKDARRRIDGFGEWLGASWKRVAPDDAVCREEIEARARDWRAELVSSLEELRARERGPLEWPFGRSVDDPRADEYLRVEREAIEAAIEETVYRSILAYFDATVAAARGL